MRNGSHKNDWPHTHPNINSPLCFVPSQQLVHAARERKSNATKNHFLKKTPSIGVRIHIGFLVVHRTRYGQARTLALARAGLGTIRGGGGGGKEQSIVLLEGGLGGRRWWIGVDRSGRQCAGIAIGSIRHNRRRLGRSGGNRLLGNADGLGCLMGTWLKRRWWRKRQLSAMVVGCSDGGRLLWSGSDGVGRVLGKRWWLGNFPKFGPSTFSIVHLQGFLQRLWSTIDIEGALIQGIPQLVSKMPRRPFECVRNTGLHGVLNGRRQMTVLRIARSQVFLEGTRFTVRNANVGRIGDVPRLLAAFGFFRRANDLVGLEDFEIPAIKAKDVVQSACDGFTRKIGQFATA